MAAKSFSQLFAEVERKDSFHAALVALDFTESLARIMTQKGITKAEFARKLGTSQAYVTKVLRGDANFTLETMVRLSRALDCRLYLNVAENECEMKWVAVVQGGKQRMVAGKNAYHPMRKVNEISDETLSAAA